MVTKRFVLGFLLLISSAFACRCRLPELKKQYFDEDIKNVVKATALYRFASGGPLDDIVYGLRVEQSFKGCEPSESVKVFTAGNSAACGAFLEIGKTYILPIRTGTRPNISSCDFIKEVGLLSEEQESFLDARQTCCEGKCECANGSPPVLCKTAPCSVSTAPCDDAVSCEDNYCGGCIAEWFDAMGCLACREIFKL